jgi:hypothetical protein
LVAVVASWHALDEGGNGGSWWQGEFRHRGNGFQDYAHYLGGAQLKAIFHDPAGVRVRSKSGVGAAEPLVAV